MISYDTPSLVKSYATVIGVDFVGSIHETCYETKIGREGNGWMREIPGQGAISNTLAKAIKISNNSILDI